MDKCVTEGVKNVSRMKKSGGVTMSILPLLKTIHITSSNRCIVPKDQTADLNGWTFTQEKTDFQIRV